MDNRTTLLKMRIKIFNLIIVSIFRTSLLVTMVSSPSMDVVQYVKVVKKVTLGCTAVGATLLASAVLVTVSYKEEI